ncbi:hypothetical protein DFH06DRAFT_1330121 [Mycena polygramma]|nr:hypothetical protein DFH06DRAFT_1330121 [Mycena polygramma]
MAQEYKSPNPNTSLLSSSTPISKFYPKMSDNLPEYSIADPMPPAYAVADPALGDPPAYVAAPPPPPRRSDISDLVGRVMRALRSLRQARPAEVPQEFELNSM